MSDVIEHLDAHTWHGRKGGIENAFRYSIDYVLLEPEIQQVAPTLFSRNRWNLFSVSDHEHGGVPHHGKGAAWAREVLASHDLPSSGRLLLLTQPRVLGHVFNPVSFWLSFDASDKLRVVIAEVTNTFGQRHSYLCHRDDLEAIGAEDVLTARKIFHVSPFQPISGGYRFRFDVRDERIGIWIDLTHGEGGVTATLTGRRAPLTNRTILRAMWRRPFGSRRVLALIHWQALKLAFKRARFRSAPDAPLKEVSR